MYFKPGEQKIKPILNKQQFNERDGSCHCLQITHGKSWIPRRNMTIHKQGDSNKRGPDHPLQSFKNGEGGLPVGVQIGLLETIWDELID